MLDWTNMTGSEKLVGVAIVCAFFATWVIAAKIADVRRAPHNAEVRKIEAEAERDAESMAHQERMLRMENEHELALREFERNLHTSLEQHMLESDEHTLKSDLEQRMSEAEIKRSACDTCAGVIHWVNAPTGGWWAHRVHPFDEHEAVPALGNVSQ